MRIAEAGQAALARVCSITARYNVTRRVRCEAAYICLLRAECLGGRAGDGGRGGGGGSRCFLFKKVSLAGSYAWRNVKGYVR